MDTTKTVTSLFMAPTLGIPLKELKDNGYINSYSIDANLEQQYDDAIYLLFKPEDINKFREFLEEEYSRTEAIIDDYDYEGGYVVVVYSLEPEFYKDFSLVREGKYSQTSKDLQLIFPKEVDILNDGYLVTENSIQYRIFNKTKDLVNYWEEKIGVAIDIELEQWPLFNLEKETLKL